mgnify:CR=1 FL=1
MNTLIKKVLEYQKSKNEIVFEEIINILKPVINTYVSKIDRYYSQDLKQELLYSIYKSLLKFKHNKKEITINLGLSDIKKIYDEIIKHKYYDSFKVKFVEFKSLDILKTNDIIKMINEFYLFCNQNQFKNYINKVLNNKLIDFIRTNKIDREIKIISLNIVNDYDGEELLYKIPDTNLSKIYSEIDYSLLTNKEVEFLNLFYKDNEKLTEIEVANILGISQQAVSKRLIKIKNKLKKI